MKKEKKRKQLTELTSAIVIFFPLVPIAICGMKWRSGVVVGVLIAAAASSLCLFFAGFVCLIQEAASPVYDSFVDRSPCTVESTNVSCLSVMGVVGDNGCMLRTKVASLLSMCGIAAWQCRKASVWNCAVLRSDCLQVVLFSGDFETFQSTAKSARQHLTGLMTVCFAVGAAPLVIVVLALFLLWRGSDAQQRRKAQKEMELERAQRSAVRMILVAAVLKQQSDSCWIAKLNLDVLRRILDLI